MEKSVGVCYALNTLGAFYQAGYYIGILRYVKKFTNVFWGILAYFLHLNAGKMGVIQLHFLKARLEELVGKLWIMNTFEFLSELREKQIHISVNGEKLKINAPKGALTAEIKRQLGGRKTEILAFLQQAQSATQSKQPPIERIEREGQLPLSLAQERVWKLHQLAPNGTAFHIPVAWRLIGQLNKSALEHALTGLVARFEILRTIFPAGTNNTPYAQINPPTPITLGDTQDLSHINLNKALDRIESDSQTPFDLTTGSLMRPTLYQLDEDDYILLLAFHQIVFDWGAAGALIASIETDYKAAIDLEVKALSELSVAYVDFAQWQRDWLQGEVLDKQLAHWQEQLATPYRPLPLPLDRPRPEKETFQANNIKLRFTPEQTSALKKVSQQNGTTLFTTLLAAFQALLAGYSEREDIIVFSTGGLNRPELKKLVGLFGNPLPLRTDLSGAPTFRELSGRVQQTISRAFNHQDLPLEKIIDLAQTERGVGLASLFQVLFIFQHEPTPELELPDLSTKLLTIGAHGAAFDLRLFLEETPKGLQGWLEYKTDLFDEETIVRMGGRLKTLLERVVEAENQPIAELLPLTEVDRVNVVEDDPAGAEITPLEYTPPTDELEFQLVQTWQNIFNLPRIGIRDSFFDLGGHSLMALDMLAEIEKLTDKKLPMSTLFEAPTIEKLAVILRNEGWEVPFGSLVPIQPNGTKPVLFCVAALGNEIILFAEAARLLGEDQPFYGLQQGSDACMPVHTTVSEIADHYISEMRELQPEGPYYLAGYCFGGLVAFEMAQKLEAQGQEIAKLLLIDAETPGSAYPLVTQDNTSRTKHRIRRLFTGGPAYVAKRVRLLWERRIWTWLRARMHSYYTRRGQVLPESLRDITQINLQAQKHYIPGTYSGDVTLFEATDRFANFYYAPLLGWDNYIEGEITSYKVPGDHEGIWKEPHVQVFAEQLRESIA